MPEHVCPVSVHSTSVSMPFYLIFSTTISIEPISEILLGITRGDHVTGRVFQAQIISRGKKKVAIGIFEVCPVSPINGQ